MSTSQAPVWASLVERGGAHWRTLSRDYVPVGLLELIQFAPRSVLDVGCFCGATGAWLKSRYPGIRVVGIEPLAEAAVEARQRLDAVLLGKLEEIDLRSAGILPGTVDIIVLADVLEHMYDPWHALLSLRPLLGANGVILASIPNMGNITVLEQLSQGDFPYAEAGLLDITHVRFFTWKGVQRLFGETGYRIDAVSRNIDGRSGALLGALEGPMPVNIDSPSLQLKNLTREQVTDLATLQYWLRASLA